MRVAAIITLLIIALFAASATTKAQTVTASQPVLLSGAIAL